MALWRLPTVGIKRNAIGWLLMVCIRMTRSWRAAASCCLRNGRFCRRQNAWYWLEVPGAIKLVEHPRLHWVRWGLVAFLWVRLTGVAAAVIWVWRRGWAPHRFELALLAFFALAPALLYPIPRYLAPACPLLDGLAAIAIARSRGWWT